MPATASLPSRARALALPLPLALLLSAACQSSAPAEPASAAPPAMSQAEMEAEMMAKMAAFGTPGPEHAELAKTVGTWKVEGKMYWEPGGEPTPMTATAEREMILDGRILKESFHSDFMGQPFEGVLLQGYDRVRGEHWSVWFDNMSTWGSFSSGREDGSGALVLNGVMHDAIRPEDRRVRSVLHTPDPWHANMQMYDTAPDGTLFLVMDMDYTRQ